MLGAQSQILTDTIIDQYRDLQLGILKPINCFNPRLLTRYKNEVKGYIFPRVWVDDEPANLPNIFAQRVADRVCKLLDPIHSLVDATHFMNELAQNGESLKWLNDATTSYTEIMHARGYKVIGGSFSVGNPGNPQDILFFKDALAILDYWDYHAYSAPSLQTNSQWNALRYKTYCDILTQEINLPPLLLGEVGIDGGLIGRSKQGWKDISNEENFRNDLLWLLSQTKDCFGLIIFGLGMNQDWQSFDVNNTNILKGLGGFVKVPLMEEGFGFREWQSLEPKVIGEFRESEVWHDQSNSAYETSIAWTSRGQLRWIKQTNTMDFFDLQSQKVRIFNGGHPRWLS